MPKRRRPQGRTFWPRRRGCSLNAVTPTSSVEEIAEEAGYSHGAVYSNFDGKADLFLTVFEDYMAERARELAATQIDLGEDAPLVTQGPRPS